MTKQEQQLKVLLRSYGHRYYKIAQTEKQDYDAADNDFIPKIIKLLAKPADIKNDSDNTVKAKLPEYNEVQYHAKLLTSERFREYWQVIVDTFTENNNQ